jgi:acyl-CoA thioester hydrolase
MSTSTSPLLSPLMDLQSDWIDYNGHLNMAFYNVLFDRGCDFGFEALGMGPEYVDERKLTIYTAEAHVKYEREVHMGDRVQASFQILDYDEKRLHIFQELRHEDGWISATSENITLHIDMSGPKVAPFPEDVFSKIEPMALQHKNLPYPENAGRHIEIRRKKA